MRSAFTSTLSARASSPGATATRLASSSCASRPYTASQPGFTSTLPLVWNLCSSPFFVTVLMRVVTIDSAGG